MGFECRVERDSISPLGNRLTTMVVTYPRSILAEMNTHRVFSRNTASSRAIPTSRLMKNILKDPYVPQWTLNQKGMQGEPLIDTYDVNRSSAVWYEQLEMAMGGAGILSTLNVHKQDVNRLLEPWMWTTQIITSTEWDNFFALRCHKDAHPAFQKIARMMYLALRASTPIILDYTQWHLPFVPLNEQMACKMDDVILPIKADQKLPDLVKFSIARCAWVSYENHDKDGSKEALLSTYDRLMKEPPIHASPCEHQATPVKLAWALFERHFRSNFEGWIQARKLIPNENITKYEPSEEEVSSWGL